MKVVHFGAGNIGRGFIGKVLADAGAEIAFADVVVEVVNLLKERGRYGVTIAGETNRSEPVANVTGVLSTGEEVVDLIAAADLVTTAVGPTILPRIAPVIAKGLERRIANGNTKAVNVIACENMVRGTTYLKGFVLEKLADDVRAKVEEMVGFADSAVDRIVPPQTPPKDAPLDVTVEEFSEWIVDRGQLKGWTRDIPGMKLTDNLPAFIERKLFTVNTGHAVAAYFGALAGCATIQETMTKASIVADIRATMKESGDVLVKRHGLDYQEHQAYIDKILKRFANPSLIDDVRRVAREPIRKLGRNERFISPLLGTLEYGLPHRYLVRAIAAVLVYEDVDDRQANELQSKIASVGLVPAFNEISDNAVPAEVTAEIAALVSEFNGRGRPLPKAV